MRRREIVKAPADYGRDAGKHFEITEWDAARAESWAIRALLAFSRGGSDFPIEVVGRGMEGVFYVGIQTFLRGQVRAEEVIPILNELLECVQMIRDPKARDKDTGRPVVTPIVSDDDIGEVRTRLWLRSEVIRVHTDFSVAEILSRLISAAKIGASLNTETSLPRSDSSSAVA